MRIFLWKEGVVSRNFICFMNELFPKNHVDNFFFQNSVGVSSENIFTYDDNYEVFANKSSRKGFKKAVEECDQFLQDPEVFFINIK